MVCVPPPEDCRWPPGHRWGIPPLENQAKPHPTGALGPVAPEPCCLGGGVSRELKAEGGPVQCPEKLQLLLPSLGPPKYFLGVRC